MGEPKTYGILLTGPCPAQVRWFYPSATAEVGARLEVRLSVRHACALNWSSLRSAQARLQFPGPETLEPRCEQAAGRPFPRLRLSLFEACKRVGLTRGTLIWTAQGVTSAFGPGVAGAATLTSSAVCPSCGSTCRTLDFCPSTQHAGLQHQLAIRDLAPKAPSPSALSSHARAQFPVGHRLA